MKLKHILFAAVAVAGITLPFAYADTPNSTAGTPATSPDAVTALFGDPVVAKGTGVSVKRSELDQVVSGIKSAASERGEELSQEQLTQVQAQMLERLIDIQLLLQNANDADRATGAKKANTALSTLLERAGSQATLDMQLKAAGTSMAQLRAKVTDEATAMQTLQRILNVTVGDAEIKAFYDGHPADFEQPEMVHVRHILLMTIDPTTHEPLSDDQVEAKRKEANDVLTKARSGEDFTKLAEQYSDDTTTKEKGGELPAFPHGQMLPEFEAAAFALTNNEVSDVVKTMYGFHIIKFIDRTPPKTLTLADTVPSINMTVSDWIKQELEQQKMNQLAPAYLAKLKKAAGVQVTDPDLSAAIDALSNTNAAPAGAAAPMEK
jgi:parvulin-like peptidyl-prolyl isomerase